jgi:hypothetical protein
MIVKIGAEAAQFSEEEYINGIAVAVRWKLHEFSSSPGFSILTKNFLKILSVFRMEPSSCRWHSRTNTRWKLREFSSLPGSSILTADTFPKMLSVFRMEPSSCSWHSRTSTRWKLRGFSSSPGSSILTENFLKMLCVQNGTFKLQMTFTDKYPLKAPRVQFLTRIFHPNISTSGEICLDVLRDEKW